MKNLIILFSIVIIIIGLTLFEFFYLQSTFDDFTFFIEVIKLDIENEVVENEDINQLIKYWENKRKILHIIIPHVDIRNIEIYLAELQSSIENDDYVSAHRSINVLLNQSINIPKAYIFTLENIL